MLRFSHFRNVSGIRAFGHNNWSATSFTNSFLLFSNKRYFQK